MAGSSSARAVLEVRDLRVSYSSETSPCLIDGLSFQLHAGEIVGIEGRSGCGKTTTALTVLKLLPPYARVSGSVIFEDQDLLTLSERELRNLRCNKISIIYQEPTLALNPFMRVGDQITEVLRAHRRASRGNAEVEFSRCWNMSDSILSAITDSIPTS